ncbi:MAG: MFS transporter [Betaproteobacteria bacterium]|nr:MFS transporter [Betaproteobacteria bacterium]
MIERGLARLGRIEPGEGRALGWAFAYFFFLLCAYYILRPLRDEMGVAAGLANLQWLFTATFFVMLAAMPAFGALVARLPRRRFIPWVYRFFALTLLVFWALLTLDVGRVLVARALFVWVSVFNLFVVTVFWGFMSERFGYERGRRLFGFIAAGGTAGALLGPSITALLAVPLGPANLLLVSVLLLEVATLCAGALDRAPMPPAAGNEPATQRPDEAIGGGMWGGLTEVLRSRYLMLICAHVALLSLTSTFLYFQQAAIVAGAFDSPAERTRVFALIDLSVGVTTLAVQVLFTGRLMLRFGAGVALALLAIVTAAGFAAIALAPVLAVVIGFQAVKRAAEFSLANPARETLFTVVTREQMYKSKSFIDTAVFRGADAASGWIYTALRQAAALEASLVAWLTVPVALGWAVMLLKLGAMQREHASRRSDDGPAS